MKRLLTLFTLTAALAALVAAGLSRPGEAAPADTSQQYLPVAFADTRGDLPPSLFGLQIYAPSGSSSPYFPNQYLTGATWIRVPIHWSWIEEVNTTPDNYYWPPADTALSGALDGFEMIATLGINPSWASTDPYGRIDKVPLSEFTDFLSALVERFDGDGIDDAPGSPRVTYWEMFNEPDAGPRGEYTGWGLYEDEYAVMLEEAYTAIKAANSSAKVLFGGIAYDWFWDEETQTGGPFREEFLPNVLDANGCSYFDYMNFHAYPAFADNWADYGPGLIEKTEAIRAVILDHCGFDKPFMVTESGWHSNATPPFPDTTPETQSNYVVQLFAQARAANIDSMIWWLLSDEMIGDEYPYKNGLIGDLGEYKPAFKAYINAMAELATADFVRTWSVAETGAVDLEVHQFDDGASRRTLYVAWVNPINTTAKRTLRVPTENLVKRTLYGVATPLTDLSDGVNDGFVTLQVGGAPLYLEIER